MSEVLDCPDIVERAAAFAFQAHYGQQRKYTFEPYFTHCLNVAEIVRVNGGSDEMVAAALLHDVLEDTPVQAQRLHDLFGYRVAHQVIWLTDHSKPEHGNRAVRKEIDRSRLAKAPAEAQTIKVADMIDNSMSIIRYDPGFAKVFMAEKKLLLDCLIKADPNLRGQALAIYFEFQDRETAA